MEITQSSLDSFLIINDDKENIKDLNSYILLPENYIISFEKTADDNILKFLKDMLILLDKSEHNGILLRNKTKTKNSDILIFIMRKAFCLIESQTFYQYDIIYEKIYEIFEKLCICQHTEYIHFEYICQFLSQKSANFKNRDEFNQHFFLYETAYKFIEIMLKTQLKLIQDKNSQNIGSYLFFAPEKCKLLAKLQSISPWPFKNVFLLYENIGLHIYNMVKNIKKSNPL